MTPVYRLKFFDFMGVAEPIRYLFAYGGITYDNVVVQKGDWDKVQKVIPFGKLPVLEIDDKVLYQSVAISQYLGKKVGLVPTDDFEAAELYAIAATVFDFGTKVHDWYHEESEQMKTMLYKELDEKVIPRYLTDFETIVKKKGTYFGGNQVTWADVYFVGIFESIQGMVNKELLQTKYPLLYKLFWNVRNIPEIKAYILKRPSYKI